MITKELQEYVRSAIAQGQSYDTIRTNLLTQGWHLDEIQEAYKMQTATPIVTARKSRGWIAVVLILILLGVGGASAYYFKKNAANVIGNTDITGSENTPAMASFQTAVDNFAKLNSYTFTGNETGKAALGLQASTFSGIFENSPEKACVIIRTVPTTPNKYNGYSSEMDIEDRIIGDNDYQFIKGVGNTQINNKWTQMKAPGREDIELFHLSYPLHDSAMNCNKQLPALSLFSPGSVVSQNNSEIVYALVANQDLQKLYASDFAIKNIPGGQQTLTGEITIDVQTALPKNISIYSSAFADPLFVFNIIGTNIPVDISVPAGITPINYNQVNTQNVEKAELTGVDADIKNKIANLRAAAELVYSASNSYGTVSNSGNCANPTLGSVFNPGKSTSTADMYTFLSGIQTETKMNTTCFSTPAQYAISAKLPGSGEYWCADNTGVVVKINGQITGPHCQ